MSDRKAALQALLDAVEAGEYAPDFECLGRGILNAASAYCGSLDAAKALHEAVLPGWCFLITMHDAEIWPENFWPETTKSQFTDKPACAWLAAILKALIAEAGND